MGNQLISFLILLGLPPFFPLILEATCFFSDLERPPLAAISFIQAFVPNTPCTHSFTPKSRSSSDHVIPHPAGVSSTWAILSSVRSHTP
jgi:hypothetical protein